MIYREKWGEVEEEEEDGQFWGKGAASATLMKNSHGGPQIGVQKKCVCIQYGVREMEWEMEELRGRETWAKTSIE